jgi:hypothetical protein
MSTTTDIRHLTDGELVGILDGGDDTPGPERLAHLETCDRCADALDGLQADSALLRDYLERANFEDGGPRTAWWRGTRGDPARTGPWASSWWKAAAILVLVAAPLAAIPGVRAWIVDAVTTPDAPAALESITPPPTVLRFTPDPGDFVVAFEPGTAGTIALERSASPEAELRAQGGDPETVVAAASLSIRNDAPATYRLRLPASITGAWVRLGDRAVAVSGDQIDRRAVVELGNGTPKVR